MTNNSIFKDNENKYKIYQALNHDNKRGEYVNNNDDFCVKESRISYIRPMD